MAKPVIIEDADLSHLVKITRATSCNSTRNIALIYTLFGTGMMPSEMASLLVSDYMHKGNPNPDYIIRPEISFNGRSRPIMWVNKKLTNAIDAYLLERIERGLGSEPRSPLFLARGTDGFSFRATEKNGKTYRACSSLTNLLNKLISGAGLEGCNTASARRTLAVKLHRQRIDLRSINEILGQSSMTATKKMCQGDTNRLSRLVANVI
jgi:site-specific recombinase XerD